MAQLIIISVFSMYWFFLETLITSFGPIESTWLELFISNFRDLRYFYLLPYFLGRFSVVISFLVVGIVVISSPHFLMVFPSILPSTNIGDQFTEVTQQIGDSCLLLLVSVIYILTWSIVRISEQFDPQSFTLLILWLLWTNIMNTVIELAIPSLILLVITLFFLEGTQFVVLSEKNSLNKRRIYSQERIPFAVILPILFVVFIFLFLSSWLFMVAFLLIPLLLLSFHLYYNSPLLVTSLSGGLEFYMVRGWLVRNFFFVIFLSLWSLSAIYYGSSYGYHSFPLPLFLSWIFIRILVQFFFGSIK